MWYNLVDLVRDSELGLERLQSPIGKLPNHSDEFDESFLEASIITVVRSSLVMEDEFYISSVPVATAPLNLGPQ